MFETAGAYPSKALYLQKTIGSDYVIDFTPGSSTLVLTFASTGAGSLEAARAAEPWGLRWLAPSGVSVAGVKPVGTDWYRGEALHAFLRSQDFATFLGGFDRIVLTGGLMGGFAALAFADAVPGAEVIAFSPQSTLDPRIVPWDMRYPEAAGLDWDGDFSDAARFARSAGRIHVVYDSLGHCDRLHVERLPPESLVRLRVPLIGRASPLWLARTGLLQELLADMLAGRFDAQAFARKRRTQRGLGQYHVELSRLAGRRRAGLRKWALERATALGATDVSAHIGVALAHVDAGDLAAAETALFRLIELKPGLPHGYYQMAQLLMRQDRCEEALRFARKAAAISPANRVYRAWLDRHAGVTDHAGAA